jgi:hypothetical protein
MDSAQHQLIEKLQSSTNILVTVSRNPSVDQLAACLGLTLILNKIDKHATAVFSGQIPSTIDFLQPDQTLEKNTDSLRDFIIALDKSKADKLRYKVEDDLVRIFITPYKTSISQADLEFSQGDFNVDMVVALGVENQEDLDEAIIAHGRILHDATVTSINAQTSSDIGSINWNDQAASSLCELIAVLQRGLGQNLYDPQIATALLTGIVAQTKRFSNERTTPATMSISAELMAAGANQQLVASELEAPLPELQTDDPADAVEPTTDDDTDQSAEVPNAEPAAEPTNDDGTLEIEHSDDEELDPNDQSETADDDTTTANEVLPEAAEDKPTDDTTESAEPEVELQDSPNDEDAPEVPKLRAVTPDDTESETAPVTDEPVEIPTQEPKETLPETTKLITEPPTLGGQLTANSVPESYDPSTDPLSAQETTSQQLLTRADHPGPIFTPTATKPESASDPVIAPLLTGFTPPPPAWVPPSDDALNFGTPIAPSSPVALVGLADPQTATDLATFVSNDSEAGPTPDADAARDKVTKALQSSETVPEPIVALNAQPMIENIQETPTPPPEPLLPLATPDFTESLRQVIPAIPLAPATTHEPPLTPPAQPVPGPDASTPAAPPVPPPIPFHFGTPSDQSK